MTPRHCRLCDHVTCTCCSTGHGLADCLAHPGDPTRAHCVECMSACPECADA